MTGLDLFRGQVILYSDSVGYFGGMNVFINVALVACDRFFQKIKNVSLPIWGKVIPPCKETPLSILVTIGDLLPAVWKASIHTAAGNFMPVSQAPSPICWEGSNCVFKHGRVFFVSLTQSLRACGESWFYCLQKATNFHKRHHLSEAEKTYCIDKRVKSVTSIKRTVEHNVKELWKCNYFKTSCFVLLPFYF